MSPLRFMLISRTILYTIITIFFYNSLAGAQSWQSSRVQIDESGKLTYLIDADGNRIPDFSYAGYRNSEVNLPYIETVLTISPVEGDNTAHIQTAIDMVGSYTPDVNGFRGALYLQPGIYEISGIIYLNHSGVVLRGAGDGAASSSNTILRAVGNSPYKRTVLIAGGGDSTRWSDAEPNTNQNIVTDLVPVGSRSFEVEDASPFQVGDNIIIKHPCTQAWIDAVEGGGTGTDPDWNVGEMPLVFNRYIKSIQGNWITIDAPVFNHLDRSLAQSFIYKYARYGLLTNIGIENLRIDIQTSGGLDESHAWDAIKLYQIEDSWVKNCTMLHFAVSGICTNTASRITIENCQTLDPVSQLTGSMRYNFHLLYASQLILFKDCHASNGRHHYISNGTSYVSGCVFYNCTSSGAYTSSEGHRRWSMGLLFDNHRELNGPRSFFDPRLLGLYNRGSWGTGHGWAAAHSVCWNCDVANGNIALQKPPTAQNYAIGCFADQVTGTYFSWTVPYPGDPGHIEGVNTPGLEPASLFMAQLADRLSGPPAPTGPIVDTFSDGNFTANPVWTGDTDKWQILTDSDISGGANNSYTLRLNENYVSSGPKYLSTHSTASWGSSQSWGFWMGRRLSPASDLNQSIVWLWANESDLRSSTVDGYRIRFGDNIADDEIVLQKVNNGSVTDILTSSGSIPNGLTDYGFLVRVTRTESSLWTIFTSSLPAQNGQGAIATDIPAVPRTQVYQGSAMDFTHTNFDNGYFGFMAIHESDFYSRRAVEFDQLYFAANSDASLPVGLISFTATPGNGEVELNWSTSSEIENIGFIILRGYEECGDYSELDSYKKNVQLMGAGNSSEAHDYQYIDYNVTNNVTYWYKLLDVDLSGMHSAYGPVSARPYDRETFYLGQNYPNPFNPKTVISYALPVSSYADISIYNILGQKVKTLLSRNLPAGFYEIEWDASQFNSGIYYYYLRAGEYQAVKKMALLK